MPGSSCTRAAVGAGIARNTGRRTVRGTAHCPPAVGLARTFAVACIGRAVRGGYFTSISAVADSLMANTFVVNRFDLRIRSVRGELALHPQQRFTRRDAATHEASQHVQRHR